MLVLAGIAGAALGVALATSGDDSPGTANGPSGAPRADGAGSDPPPEPSGEADRERSDGDDPPAAGEQPNSADQPSAAGRIVRVVAMREARLLSGA